MLSHEDLWIKISDDFHSEINPILEQINSESKQSFWFDKKGILNKFYIIKDVLLALNGTEVNQYHLTRLTAILEAYKNRIELYFENYNIATCFVYFSPQNNYLIENFLFKKFSEYCLAFNFQSFKPPYIYMIGMNLVGFPNDCHHKLTALTKNNKIEIQRRDNPFFEIEKERGKLIGNVNRTRDEQEVIEVSLIKQNPDFYYNAEDKVMNEFKEFSELVFSKINTLLLDFDNSIELCKKLISQRIDSTEPANLPEIQKIYNVLINGYIQEPIERFLAIFQNDYSGEKIVWLKDGAEFKFLLDMVISKIISTNKINQWADKRFILVDTPTNFIAYLGSVKQKNKLYDRLISGTSIRSNPIYKLSKVF